MSSLSMPLEDALKVSKYHSVFSLSQVVGHPDNMKVRWSHMTGENVTERPDVGLLGLLALTHVGDVGGRLLQVRHIHKLGLQQLLNSLKLLWRHRIFKTKTPGHLGKVKQYH